MMNSKDVWTSNQNRTRTFWTAELQQIRTGSPVDLQLEDDPPTSCFLIRSHRKGLWEICIKRFLVWFERRNESRLKSSSWDEDEEDLNQVHFLLKLQRRFSYKEEKSLMGKKTFKYFKLTKSFFTLKGRLVNINIDLKSITRHYMWV